MARVRSASGAGRPPEPVEAPEPTGALVPARTSGSERPPARERIAVPAARPKGAGTARRPRAAEARPRPRLSPEAEQVLLIVGLALCLFTVIALGSYHPTDASFSVVGSEETQNLAGPVGAWLADFAYQVFGWAAWSVLAVGARLALRLAGRRGGSAWAWLVGAVGIVALSSLLELILGGGEGSFRPGGLVGLFTMDAVRPGLGIGGAWLLVLTTLIGAATLLFRIDWQPLAARAVDGVRHGGPAAARLVGGAGVGAVRAWARVVGAVAGALVKRIRAWVAGEEDEDEELEEEIDEGIVGESSLSDPSVSTPRAPAAALGAAPRPAAGTERMPAPRAPQVDDPAARTPRALPPREPVLPAPLPVARPAAPPPVSRAGGGLAGAVPARPLPPAAWPGETPDTPTAVGGNTLVEVEWSESGSVPRVEPARPPRPLPAAADLPPLSSRTDTVPLPAVPRVEPARPSAALPRPPVPPAPAEARRPAGPGRPDEDELDGDEPDDRGLDPDRLDEDGPDEDPRDEAPAARPAGFRPPLEPDDEADEPPARPGAPVRAARARVGNASDAQVTPGNLQSGGKTDDGGALRRTRSPFRLPMLSLLDEHPAIVGAADEGVLLDQSRRLSAKLLDFGVEGRVTHIRPGPVITLFEYEPAPGVKLSRIASLSDDLAMALKAISVRIVAPIPGRGVVGIEIPNERRQTVWARDVFASPEFRDGKHTLPIVLGKDTEGKPYVGDLARMPHLLIGGTTGSGKSVGVNSMLVSMLFQRTPEELRLILVDPKMLEFELYQDIPHLLHPVVTEPKLASAVLKWACVEMDERYRLLARWQTRNIEGYNEKVTRELADWTPDKARRYAPKDWPEGDLLPIPKRLPYIVIVIDELADLMMVAAKDVEESIVRLAQKARACGIHLIVATQRPSVDVITGLIKANMPSRIAYQVRSKTDGRTILDQNGAETLLGKGDLLFLPPGTAGLVRIHGPFLADDEVRRIAEFCKEQGPPEYAPKIKLEGAEDEDEDLSEEMDENYDRAVQFAIEKGRISTSMIQRLLKIGYNRAARIMEIMEREGVVGAADGAKPREVLVQER